MTTSYDRRTATAKDLLARAKEVADKAIAKAGTDYDYEVSDESDELGQIAHTAENDYLALEEASKKLTLAREPLDAVQNAMFKADASNMSETVEDITYKLDAAAKKAKKIFNDVEKEALRAERAFK